MKQEPVIAERLFRNEGETAPFTILFRQERIAKSPKSVLRTLALGNSLQSNLTALFSFNRKALEKVLPKDLVDQLDQLDKEGIDIKDLGLTAQEIFGLPKEQEINIQIRETVEVPNVINVENLVKRIPLDAVKNPGAVLTANGQRIYVVKELVTGAPNDAFVEHTGIESAPLESTSGTLETFLSNSPANNGEEVQAVGN